MFFIPDTVTNQFTPKYACIRVNSKCHSRKGVKLAKILANFQVLIIFQSFADLESEPLTVSFIWPCIGNFFSEKKMGIHYRISTSTWH